MKILQLTFLLSLLVSCKIDGTDTGNPGLDVPASGEYPISEMFLGKVVEASCELLNRCHGGSITNCPQGIFSQTNIDTEIGLFPSDYRDLAAVQTALVNGDLTADFQALDLCAQEIEALSCAVAEVSDAYDPTLTNPLEGVAAMLPLSCTGIF